MSYDKLYSEWKSNPYEYWDKKSEDIVWDKKWEQVLDESRLPFYRWFVGGKLNTCYNCIDRHVANGRQNQLAIIYDSPITNKKKKYTYSELLNEVSKTAGALKNLGVTKGDRVLIYMPMVPESIISMLATARLGAIHSVVFGGFAASELVTRIEDAKPKVIIAASCGIEPNKIIPYKPMLDEAIQRSKHKPSNTLILQREEEKCHLTSGYDLDFEETVSSSKPTDCVPVYSTDPLYILYTSGTTGDPKGIVRDNGGHAVALKSSMSMTYGINPGDVFWAASDVGWVVGHSYIVYGPLLQGCTTIVYEGKPVGTPDAGQFWRVISEHGVNVMFTSPTALRAIKREDPNATLIKKYNLSNFRHQFLAGERADPDTIEWTRKVLKVPVIDHWWQTETGWSIAGNFIEPGLFLVKPGSTGKAAPGYDVNVINNLGKIAKTNTIGSLVIKLPLPPGCSPTLWKNEKRFKEAYLDEYPGYYSTSDAGFIDSEGYISVMSRTDDIINCAGHRLSTGGIEEVLSKHPDVAECAVVGVKDELKGQIPLGFLVLKKGHSKNTAVISEETVKMVREEIGAVASYQIGMIVSQLPKTRSGKILRATIAKIADSVEVKVPATIENPDILKEIKKVLISNGYAK